MICRICLFEVVQSECVNIFAEVRNQELISDLIMNFSYIEIFEEDPLPKTVCLVCLKHLNDIYDFKELIIKSDAYLREMQNTSSDSDNDRSSEKCDNLYNEEGSFNENTLSYDQPVVQIECQEPLISFNSCDKSQKFTDNEKNSKIQGKGYKCDQCQSCFKNRYKLILHKASHTGTFPHSCDVCKKGFATNWAMTVHRRIHFEERPFKCELCDKSFKSKSAQIIHRKIHLGIKRYQCKVCGKQFVQMGGLKAHQYTHTNEKPLVCEFCGKHYTSKRALDRHSRIHRGSPNEPCPMCGKLYAGEANVKIHMKTVHSEDRARFPCEVCNKNFSSKSVLKIHMRIHEGVKPFSCDICGKKFRQASVATLHKRVHTGETPFPCTFCDRKFAYKHHLKKHLGKEHVKKEFD